MILKKLISTLKDSVFSPVYHLAAEYIEIGIDEVLENNVLQEIPVMNTISTAYKVGLNIRERNLAKQTLAFLRGFNNGSISQEQLNAHREELESNPDKLEQELSRIIIILDEHIETMQSQILGTFYLSYVKSAISWDKFRELSEANRKMFFCDYKILREAALNDGLMTTDCKLYQVDRLISLGLLNNNNRLGGSVSIIPVTASKHSKDILLTSFGKTFYHQNLQSFPFSQITYMTINHLT